MKIVRRLGRRPTRRRRALPSLLELQLHPADIRRTLRTLFLGRRGQRLLLGAIVAVGLLVMAGLALLPWSVPAAWRTHRFHEETARQQQLLARLGALVERWDALAAESEELRHEVGRVYLVYGLEERPDAGRGGFPVSVVVPPDLPELGPLRRGFDRRAAVQERLLVLSAFLQEIEAFERAHADQVRLTPSAAPLTGTDFVLTSPFGYRRSPFTGVTDLHAGLDLAAPHGKPILAPADGEVVFAGRYPLQRSVAWWRYGNLVALRHGDRFTTLFGHCDEVLVKRGDRVRQGDVIATVGNSGWSTSPHLHYEVRQRAEEGAFVPVDPRIYILDHRWGDAERTLVSSRRAPALEEFEPLPPIIGR